MRSLISLAAFVLLTSAPAMGNDIVNPGFESGLSGWTFTPATSGSGFSVINSPAQAYMGTSFASFTGSEHDTISQTFATIPGMWYVIEMRVRNTHLGDSDGLTIRWNDQVLLMESPVSRIPVETWYYVFAGTFANSTTTTLSISAFDSFGAAGGGVRGSIHIDEVAVYPFPAPGSAAMLGAVGLVALRRKR